MNRVPYLVALACLTANTLPAQVVRQNVRVYSQDRGYCLVLPQIPAFSNGWCRATLNKIDGTTERPVWSRCLVNNSGPCAIFVASSGEYVVTMNDALLNEAGVKFPLVVYGPGGEVCGLYAWNGCDDTPSGIVSGSRCLVFFDPDDDYIFIRRYHGVMVVVELATGRIVNEKWFQSMKSMNLLTRAQYSALMKYGREELQRQILAELDSASPDTREFCARVCGQEKYRASIPALRRLLRDSGEGTDDGTRLGLVREAAAEALRVMGEGRIEEDPEPGDAPHGGAAESGMDRGSAQPEP